MLPFTAEILFSSFAQYNRALWPLPLFAVVLALVAIALVFRPVRHGDRVIAALLALAWLWTGYGYHYLHFATINFAAPLYAVFFVLEGLLLAWTGVVRGKVAFGFRTALFGRIGLIVAFAALVLWPLADGLTHGWQSARLVGLAPGPTAVFTLVLLLLTERRTPVHLAIVPLLWTLVAGATAWILAIPQDLAQPVAGIAAFGLILWHNRRLAAPRAQ